MIRIEPATAQDIKALSSSIHPDDAAELRAAGLTVEAALAGACCHALMDGDTLLALFGCAPMPGDAGAGIPWMLSTCAIDKAPRRGVAAAADYVVSSWMATHRRLSNLIHRRHARAMRFVRWLGFNVVEQPQGPGGEFFLFQWERGNV